MHNPTKKSQSQFISTLTIIFLLLFISLFLNIHYGTVELTFLQTFHEITQPFFSTIKPPYSLNHTVIWDIRIPRTLSSILAGAALATSGLLLQIFFRNLLVGPYVLGISSGGSLFVALILLGGIQLNANLNTPLILSLASFLGSSIVMLIILLISNKITQSTTLLIIGLIISYLTNAVINLLTAFAQQQELQVFVFWNLGSFNGFTWQHVSVLSIIVVTGLITSLLISKPLNALLLGEEYAFSLGIHVKKIRWIIVLISSLLASSITAFSGPIGFIGLSSPHIARLMLGNSNNQQLIPITLLLGSTLTSFCDLLARTLYNPIEIPISAITAFVGGPIIIFLLIKGQKLG